MAIQFGSFPRDEVFPLDSILTVGNSDNPTNLCEAVHGKGYKILLGRIHCTGQKILHAGKAPVVFHHNTSLEAGSFESGLLYFGSQSLFRGLKIRPRVDSIAGFGSDGFQFPFEVLEFLSSA